MPAGDTVAYAANRVRPLLGSRVPDAVATPHPRLRRDRWPERLAGRAVEAVDAHGKHLFLRFEGDLTLHSYPDDRVVGRVRARPALAALAAPRVARACAATLARSYSSIWPRVLELLTESRTRRSTASPRSVPDVLAPEFDASPSCAACEDDPTRPIGDALLDQRTLAGIGNLVKCEGCFAAAHRPLAADSEISSREFAARDRRATPAGHARIRPRTGNQDRFHGGLQSSRAGRARAAARRSAPAARATTTARPTGARAANAEARRSSRAPTTSLRARPSRQLRSPPWPPAPT